MYDNTYRLPSIHKRKKKKKKAPKRNPHQDSVMGPARSQSTQISRIVDKSPGTALTSKCW